MPCAPLLCISRIGRRAFVKRKVRYFFTDRRFARSTAFRHNGAPSDFRPPAMLNSRLRPPRPRLTGRILLYALADVFGLSCVAIGASWFVEQKGAILANFPTSAVEAVACTAGGVVVMFWAIARILRELAKQSPEMKARYDDYIATHHPDKVRRPSDDAGG